MTDNYYPGWQATLDGEPVRVVRANLLSRALYAAPAGHQIEFRLCPPAGPLSHAAGAATLSAWAVGGGLPGEDGAQTPADPLLLLVTRRFGEVPHQQFTVWDEATHHRQPIRSVTLPNVLYFWRHDYWRSSRSPTWARIAWRRAPCRWKRDWPHPHLFHAANLLVHLLNVLLVYALLRRLVGGPGAPARCCSRCTCCRWSRWRGWPA